MWVSWICGAILFVAFAAVSLKDPSLIWLFGGISFVGFTWWIAAFYRYRQIADLPTSKVASAAQGYVELVGRAEQLPGQLISSKLKGIPCCWYTCLTETRNSDGQWTTERSDTSSAPFVLVDDTGKCVIHPEGAESAFARVDTWSEGGRRFQESRLLPGQALYALGEFRTGDAARDAMAAESSLVGTLLTDWKLDQKQMVERFDLNRDGKVDAREWELARLQAQREIRQKRSAEASNAVQGTHRLRRPADGRLFLIADGTPKNLGHHFWVHSWSAFTVLVFAGGWWLVLLSRNP